MIWRLLDIFFVIFHTSIIVFNLTGWLWKKTRKYNLAILLITGFSWVIIGLLVGTIGYCPLTDWHFTVLEKIGKSDLPNSYVKYLFDRITGLDINPILADRVTLYSFLGSLLLSLILSIRDCYRGNKLPGLKHDQNPNQKTNQVF